MFSSALSWTKLFILFNISLIVIAFIFMQISQKYYTLLVITGVITNVDWALHWQRLQCLNNCKWKQLFMTYPVALRSHLDSSGRVQPFHINLHPLKKGYSPSNTLQNHVEYQFIDFLMDWILFADVYAIVHLCLSSPLYWIWAFWMTIYWCCFVIISLCSPISNVRSVNMHFLAAF